MAKKFNRYKQGVFHAQNIDKYRGKSPIILRSSYEFKFAHFVDTTPSVLKWGSESVVVRYNDSSRGGSTHRYIIDFNMTVRETNGKIVSYLVEIKPYKFTIPPKKTGRMKQSTYDNLVMTWKRNTSKWEAASNYAKLKGAKFVVLTEKHLFR